MKWYFVYPDLMIRPNNGHFFKPHIICENKKQIILDDFKARNFCKETEDLCKQAAIDLPGMISVDRSWHTFQVDGLSLQIPSADVEIFMDDIKNLIIRKGDYYKLHAFMRCFCFSQEQKENLLRQMKNVVAECAAIANIENTRFNEALAKNSHPNLLVSIRPTKKIGDA